MIQDVTVEFGKYVEDAMTGVLVYWGTGRSGKTATLWSHLDDYVSRDRGIAMFRYPEHLIEPVRENMEIRCVRRLVEIEVGEAVVFDDVALYLFSRNWGSKESKEFIEWLTVISHKDVLVMMSVQSLRLLDVLVFEPQELTLIQKHIDYEAIPLERAEYQIKALIGNLALQLVRESGYVGDMRGVSYCHRFGGTLENCLVPWWSDEYSKPYREVAIGGT